MTVTVRPGGATVHVLPDAGSDLRGVLDSDTRIETGALVFGDYSWLLISWQGESAWIAGEHTDFARSPAYDQAGGAWAESEAVLAFRRALARDLLRAQKVPADRQPPVETLSGDALRALEDSLTRQTLPAQVARIRQLAETLGLPAPFAHLPVQTSPPAGIAAWEFTGFGPNTFAFEHWPLYYEQTRGLHNGVDYVVPEGSPLIAVADGQIVDFQFLSDPADRSLALRPYLPAPARAADGSRALSNLIVGYGHLTGDPTTTLVQPGDSVRAGQIIGTSGWPVSTLDDGTQAIQRNNAHLHLETHLVSDGRHALGNRRPLNPLLFWEPRLVAFQARLAAHTGRTPYPAAGQPWGRLGFFSTGAFDYDPPDIFWNYDPQPDAIWPPGVYDLPGLVVWLRTVEPYSPENDAPNSGS